MDLVTVVIPTKNRFFTLYQAINSVIMQTYKNWEVIIVDDSKGFAQQRKIVLDLQSRYNLKVTQDKNRGTTLTLLSGKKIRLIKNQSFGASAARNTGINEANGQYICFLDSDDFFLPDKIENQIKFMKSNNLGFSHTNYLLHQVDNHRTSIVDTSLNSGINQLPIIGYRDCLIATPCVMIRSADIKNIKEIFPVDVLHGQGEDTCAWISMAIITQGKIGHLEEALTMVNASGAAVRYGLNFENPNKLIREFARQSGILEPRWWEYGGFVAKKNTYKSKIYKLLPRWLKLIYRRTKRFIGINLI